MRGRNAVLVAIATAGIIGCGSASGTRDVQAIMQLIEHHYKAPSCDDLTVAGRQAFGHPTDDAACAVDIAKQEPKSVTVTTVHVTGATGTAVADRFTFQVVKRGSRWLIDGGH